MKSKLWVMVILIYIFTWNVYSAGVKHAEEIFPTGCIPVLIKDSTIHLSASKPTVIMLHNLSYHELWLIHSSSGEGADAGWSSRLKTNHWSALALDKKRFSLHCIESRPGHEQRVPCTNMIAACEWQNAVLPENQSGTFWAGENMLLSPLIAYIQRHGFILHNNGE